MQSPVSQLQRRAPGHPFSARELDRALAAAEVEIYLTTTGMVDRAEELAADARAAGLTSRLRRALLIKSDALSRRGELEEALRMQLAILGEAERDGDRAICARAHCLIGCTYDRLADVPKCQAGVEAGVQLLDPADPPNWHAEHVMALALYTSYRRRGTVDYTSFDEAVRLAGELENPLLLMAVLNNYAFVALDVGDPRGVELSERFAATVTRELGPRAPSAWLDTIALGLLAAGRHEDAARIIDDAIAAAPTDRLEPSCLAACWLTAAAIERARGDLAAARARIAGARTIAQADGAAEAAADALKELSEVAATEGDYRAAYQLLHQYLKETAAFQTERSELHAATVQAIYGAEAERKRRLAVEQIADTDPLTGLWNRRYLNRRLAELAGRPIALALLDLDHFKQVNDRFSHDAGDAVLCRLADVLRIHVTGGPPDESFVARVGGEEFVLVSTEGDPDLARRWCDRVRAEIQAVELGAIAGDLQMTASVGLAIDPTGSLPASELLSRADRLLYEAKRAGRNRVASASV